MKARIVEDISWVTSMVADRLPESWFKQALRWLKFRFNMYAYIGVIGTTLEWSRWEDGMLHIKLNNGTELYSLPDTKDTKLWGKYRKSQWGDKLAKFQIFGGTYDRIVKHFITGIYEKNCKLQEGDIVVDAGASWGFNTVAFSQKVGKKGKVIAIEPSVESLGILRKNIVLNNCENVTVVETGLWDKKGRMKLYLKEHAAADSLVITNGQGQNRVVGTIEVELDTLDNILEGLGIDKVALLKLNIEGAEIEALKGAERTINRNNGIEIALDAHHIVDGQPTHKAIIPMMEERGFSSQLRKDGTLYLSKVSPVVDSIEK